MAKMGLQFGLEPGSEKTCLRRFRWLFKIDGISADGAQSLPPSQSARPSLSFTETEVRHVNENFYYPSKPDWQPISLVLFDVVKTNASGGRLHPIFKWLQEAYNPKVLSNVDPITGPRTNPENGRSWFAAADGFIKQARLEMLDGCGDIIETWKFEEVWPQAVDFGSLDMANNEILTCDLTLRYARAYIEN